MVLRTIFATFCLCLLLPTTYYGLLLLPTSITMAKQSTHADRVAVVALRAYTMKTSSEIAKIVDLSIATVNCIYARAIERGSDPVHTKITDEYVQDSPRAGRPTKQDPETINTILSKMRFDRFGREKTCTDMLVNLARKG
jgi:transposase